MEGLTHSCFHILLNYYLNKNSFKIKISLRGDVAWKAQKENDRNWPEQSQTWDNKTKQNTKNNQIEKYEHVIQNPLLQ